MARGLLPLIGNLDLRLAVFALAACGASVTPKESSAWSAYDANQWRLCAERWTAIADAGGKGRRHQALYYAACCHARDGKPGPAFAALDATTVDVKLLETEEDLAGLRSDPRWPRMVMAMKERFAAWEATLKEPQLRRELLALVEEDQAAREAWMAISENEHPAEWAELNARVGAADRKSTEALKRVIARVGWPGESLVGRDGAHAAWLLAQHADEDLPFQKDVLARMMPLVESGEVEARNYAYLYDRVAVAEHRKQLYGTQWNGNEPFPIEDEVNVDARRYAIGLSSLAEYRKGILEINGATK